MNSGKKSLLWLRAVVALVLAMTVLSVGAAPASAAVPDAITDLDGTAGNAQVQLTWTAPGDGGSAITDYEVQFSIDGLFWTDFADGVSATAGATVTGLTNGVSYQLQVRAKNAEGEGDWASIANRMPSAGATAPGAPTGLSGTAGNVQVALTWTAPASTGGSPITDYTVQRSTDNGDTWTTFADGTSTTTSATVTGLTNGTTYRFRVLTVNAIGTSAASTTIDRTPATVPSAITTLAGTAGNTQVSLTWTAPATGGSDITGTEIYRRTGSSGPFTHIATTTGSATTYIATILTNNTSYNFQVKALNAVGTGGDSNIISSTPAAPAPVTPVVAAATAPGTPTGLTGNPRRTTVDLSWSAPTSNGGSDITGYAVYRKLAADVAFPAEPIARVTSTNATIPGLTESTAYDFAVAAVNVVGEGGRTAVRVQTQAPPPGPPTGLRAVMDGAFVSLSWIAPTATGGPPIGSWVITAGGGRVPNTIGAGQPLIHRFDLAAALGVSVAGLSGRAVDLRVAAVTTAGQGDFAVLNMTIAVPAKVTGVRVGRTGGERPQVELRCDCPRAGTYEIERSLDGTDWATLEVFGRDSFITFFQTRAADVPIGQQSFYRIRQVSTAGVPGEWSDTASLAARPARKPEAPDDVRARFVNGTAEVDWRAPDDGGSPITDYVIQVNGAGPGGWKPLSDTVSRAPRATVTVERDSTNNRYQFRVAAVNEAGPGQFSQATPFLTMPPLPRRPDVLAVDNTDRGRPLPPTSVRLVWSVRVTGLDLTQGSFPNKPYVIEFSANRGPWRPLADRETQSVVAVITGLTPGTSYRFRVAAVSFWGTGDFSEATDPYRVPNPPPAPTNVKVVPGELGDRQAVVTWDPATNDSGEASTRWSLTVGSREPVVVTIGAGEPLTHTLRGLEARTAYRLCVSAVVGPDVGREACADFETAAPVTAPSEPRSFRATPGDSVVTLTWSEPAATGGAPVTYVIESKLEREPDSAFEVYRRVGDSARSVVVSGLTNGRDYAFRVLAVNVAGEGQPTDEKTATPIGTPGAVTDLAAEPLDFGDQPGFAEELTWKAPATTGGVPIKDYEIRKCTGPQLTANCTEMEEMNDSRVVVEQVSSRTAAAVILEEAGLHYLFVRAVNTRNLAGPWSGITVDVRETEQPPVGRVGNLLGTRIDNRVNLSWTAPNGSGPPVRGYVIEMSLGIDNWREVARTDRLAYTFSPLTAGTDFYFRVAPYNSGGSGSFAFAFNTNPTGSETIDSFRLP